ncbi:polar amino acid transport system ATP-binding protein [Streptosporangium becharense]|uniref:Polar amino acid transport system ATP-binding protein n=1 Tax=Streptosporangium becharense TaxID=1816182 RepID=A0A7W9IHG4_9ACTN|nr:amino acid ABC transporter ATP-binding protein [Streptosporangium becharense]MBB2912696.1 polar amino acid transport system ATP-binding protein [Streptosporangium becharense]MBB5820475.1 polar amino acid transport system ATP-binding protein [Streptosporangium becharense]
MSLLTIDGLWKNYRGHSVLRGIDLVVEPHEVVCLIGASGSGKSTLLRCVNLLETVDDGTIHLDGEEITDVRTDPDTVRKRMGIVFQSFNLFPHMTVLDNITLAPRKAHGVGRGEAERQARDLLARFGLADKATAYPDQLSGGQQQRAAIIRALATRPRLMLLDEVTSALDPALVKEVLGIIRELKEGGMTMILTTHEMGFCREIADTVCFLDGGVLLERGTPEQIFTDPREPRTREFLQSVIDARRL